MRFFLWNILLASVWVGLNGEFTGGNFIVGFALGFLILFLTRRGANDGAGGRSGALGYGRKAWKVVGLFLFFIKELIVANLRVAYDVLTPGYRMRPGILAVPLDARTDLEITLLANLITLTPGTLSLDVSHDRRTLYIHAMYADDPEAVKLSIKHGFERRILEVLR